MELCAFLGHLDLEVRKIAMYSTTEDEGNACTWGTVKHRLFDLRCAANYSLTRHTVFKALSQVLDAI